jgi:hypothetical protein
MAKITDEQIAQAAWTAFGDKGEQQVVIMTAVALAESSGDETAMSPGAKAGGMGALGLWQIQKVHTDIFSPAFFSTLWKNRFSNAAAARKIFDKQGIKAWVAYTNNSYAKFLPRAQVAVAKTRGFKPTATAQSELDRNLEILLGGAGLAVGGMGIPLDTDVSIDEDGNVDSSVSSSTLNAVSGLFDGLGPALWIGGGAVLVLLGIVFLAKDALPVGKIAKVLK